MSDFPARPCSSPHIHGPHRFGNQHGVFNCPGNGRTEPGIPPQEKTEAQSTLGRQFTDIYHGTDLTSARSIQREGLHPAEWNPSVHTVAFDPDTAEEYAHDAADYRRARPAVVHLQVPTDEWDNRYRGDVDDHGWSAAAGLRETVPPEYVKSVRALKKKPRSGFYG